MSDPAKALNTFIEQQQQKINELVQHIMMLETKIHLLETKNQDLENINRQLTPDKNITTRDGIGKKLKSETSVRTADPVVEKTTIQKFDLIKQRETLNA